MIEDDQELLEQLRHLVDTILTIPYYQQKLAACGLHHSTDIHAIHDFQQLPLTSKADLRENYPFGLLAVPKEALVRIHASSGTTGQPTVVGYTKRDLQLWGKIVAKDLRRLGVTTSDVVQIAFGYGLFTGGMGWHYGAEELGALVVPMSAGNTQRQLRLMQDFGTTMLICTPTYGLFLADEMEKMGISKEQLHLRLGMFGGEPWTESMRQVLAQKLGIKAYDSYGLSEIMGPGVATECPWQCGLHIDEHFYPEVVDADEHVLPSGALGQLVLSSLAKEGFPVLRYNTKDLTRLSYGTCPCGHTGWTMTRVENRSDEMLIIRGVNVFPSQIEEIILAETQLAPYYLMVVTQSGHQDHLEVQVELAAESTISTVLESPFKSRLEKKMHSVLGISVQVSIVPAQTIARSEGKTQRVMDLRRKNQVII